MKGSGTHKKKSLEGQYWGEGKMIDEGSEKERAEREAQGSLKKDFNSRKVKKRRGDRRAARGGLEFPEREGTLEKLKKD